MKTLHSKIEEKEKLLGTEDTIGSLRNRLKLETEDLTAVQSRANYYKQGLDSKLRSQTNGPIKTNPNYRQFTYHDY